MPLTGSIAATVGYGRIPGRSGIPYTQIDRIAAYLRNYMSDFRNPSFYNYWLDGNGFFINDGGSDMYDNGNVTSPVVRSGTTYVSNAGYSAGAYPFAVNYTNTASTVLDTDFYYASLGYIQYTGTQNGALHPLTVIGSRLAVDQPVGFQVGGNSGADGGGHHLIRRFKPGARHNTRQFIQTRRALLNGSLKRCTQGGDNRGLRAGGRQHREELLKDKTRNAGFSRAWHIRQGGAALA